MLKNQDEIICVSYDRSIALPDADSSAVVHVYWEDKEHDVWSPTPAEVAELCEFVNNTVGCFAAQPLGWLWHRHQRPPGPDEFWRYDP